MLLLLLLLYFKTLFRLSLGFPNILESYTLFETLEKKQEMWFDGMNGQEERG